MAEGRDEKGKFTAKSSTIEKHIDRYIDMQVKIIRELMDKEDDRIHDMIMNPDKYRSGKYNGFINLIDDGSTNR